MRQWLPVLIVVVLGSVVSTANYIQIWGWDALSFGTAPVVIRFLGTMLETVISPYNLLALPMSFRNWFGPGGGFVAIIYWPIAAFFLWRWFKYKTWFYFFGFGGMFLFSSPLWFYYVNGLAGI